MSCRGSSTKKHRHQNKNPNSEDQLICINLTGLDGLVNAADSEGSDFSRESDCEDGNRTEEEEEDRYRRRRRGECKSQQWGQDRNRPPSNKYEPADSNPRSYYPPRGGGPPGPPQQPLHVHMHGGHSHGPQPHNHGPHHHLPPVPPPPPGNYYPPPPQQNPYQQGGKPQLGECANTSIVAPAYTGCPSVPQNQNQNQNQNLNQNLNQNQNQIQNQALSPQNQGSENSSNPIRHYSLNVTACVLGLEKLEAQIERKDSIIEIRFTGSLKTNEEKYTEDIDNIAKTIKTETEKCLVTCLPPAAAAGCYQTTMLMKPGAARELKRGGTMPAWLKPG